MSQQDSEERYYVKILTFNLGGNRAPEENELAYYLNKGWKIAGSGGVTAGELGFRDYEAFVILTYYGSQRPT